MGVHAIQHASSLRFHAYPLDLKSEEHVTYFLGVALPAELSLLKSSVDGGVVPKSIAVLSNGT